MKQASAALRSLLGSNQFLMADLYSFSLVDGTMLRYCSGDRPVTANGATFLASGVRIDGGRMKLTVGLEVDQLELTIYPDLADTVGGTSFLHRLYQGGFDGARVKVERAFMASWGDTSAGTIVKFSGRVADVEFGRSRAIMRVKSDLELLDIQMPRNLYQSGCIHTLYDSGCGLAKASFGVSGTCLAGTSNGNVASALGRAAGWFDQGTVTFTSGVNQGVSRTVKAYVPGTPDQLYLVMPLVDASQPGDGFIVYPGCDKTRGTCGSKFGNLGNFRGFPFIPSPETAL